MESRLSWQLRKGSFKSYVLHFPEPPQVREYPERRVYVRLPELALCPGRVSPS